MFCLPRIHVSQDTCYTFLYMYSARKVSFLHSFTCMVIFIVKPCLLFMNWLPEWIQYSKCSSFVQRKSVLSISGFSVPLNKYLWKLQSLSETIWVNTAAQSQQSVNQRHITNSTSPNALAVPQTVVTSNLQYTRCQLTHGADVHSRSGKLQGSYSVGSF